MPVDADYPASVFLTILCQSDMKFFHLPAIRNTGSPGVSRIVMYHMSWKKKGAGSVNGIET
jgi:hypothetical protein